MAYWNIVKEGIKKSPGVARELLDDAGRVITAIEVIDWLSPDEPSEKPDPGPPPDFNPPGSLDLPGHDPGKPTA
jgi:hypothetical protein